MRSLRGIAILLVVVALAFAASPAAAQERYKHATGPAGGSWFISMGGAVKVLNEADVGVRFDGVATRGSGENARRIGDTKDIDFGLVHISTLYNAWHGIGKAFEGKPARGALIVGKMLDQGQMFVTLKESDIRKISDLEGKKVNLGPIGSGTELNSRNLLQALGLFDKVEKHYLNFAAFGRALANRQIDVAVSASTPCTITAITEASQRRPVRYISMTDEEYKKVVDQYPYYGLQSCDLKLDPMLKDVKGFEGPVKLVRYGVYYISHAGVPADTVYKVLKTLLAKDNLANLRKVHGMWRFFSGDFGDLVRVGFPLHPGAVRYWKEQGVEIPEKLIKG